MDLRVSGLVWLQKKEAQNGLLGYLRKKLTIVPRKLGDFGDPDEKPAPVLCYTETPTEFGVPRHFWFSTTQQEHNYEWDVSLGNEIHMESTLRHEGPYAEQAAVIETFVEQYERAKREGIPNRDAGLAMGGIFQADPGFGKTNTALAIVARVGVTTVVLVHKEFLLRQWRKRILKYFPGTRVGIVQEDICDYKDKDIVIAMVQSLALDDGTRYPVEFYDWPGMLIVDETHRVGAPTWAPLPKRFSAAFRMGLTATPRRKDGADPVFWWNIGNISYVAKTETMRPAVRMISVPMNAGTPDILRRRDVLSATVITILAKLTSRNKRIIREVVGALKAPAGRKVMVLSERLEHLRKLDSVLGEVIEADHTLSGVTRGFYVGEWYTGEEVPKLAKGYWPLDKDGREKAIAIIYSSLTRRKKVDGIERGYITSRVVLDDNGKPKRQKPKGKKKKGKEITEKVHVLLFKTPGALAWAATNGEDEWNDADEEGVEPEAAILEDLKDETIYNLAKFYNIAQKAKEKMRPRTEEELEEAERARVMWATYQMCSEGIDIPAVDTEVMATPVSDAEQSIGRARRHCIPDPEDPGKCKHFCPWRAGQCQGKPMVVIADVVDIGIPLAAKRENYRRTYYADKGFKVAG